MSAEESELLKALARSVVAALTPVPGHAITLQQESFVEPLLQDSQGGRSRLGEVLRLHHRIAILGPPGSGKSSLLAHRAVSSAEAYLAGVSGARCPLFVQARELEWSVADSQRVLESWIGGNVAAKNWRAVLDSGACELLVDGVDEASTPEPMLAQLGDLAAAHPSLAIVVTSRPAHLRAELRDFTTYSIAPFDRPQMIELITQLTGRQSSATESFRAALSDAPELQSIATQPMFLQLLWQLFQTRGQLPATRAILISDAIDALMFREDIKSGHKEHGLSIEMRFQIFGHLATRMYEVGDTTLSGEELMSEIAAEEQLVDAQAAAVDVFEAPWIMPAAEGRFSFAHELFQLYFIARHHLNEPGALLELVGLDESRRREILEIAAGLVDDVAPLVDACLRRGWLFDAANCLGNARAENQALCAHVAGVFRQSVPSVVLRHLAPLSSPHAQSAREPIDHYALMRKLDQACDKALPNHRRGAEFEAFTQAFFAPLFNTVQQDCRTEAGEIDLILEVRLQSPFWSEFGADVLVECKNLSAPVELKEVGHFDSKVRQARVKLAFFVSVSGFTVDAMRDLRNLSSNPLNPLVVPVTGDKIRNALRRGEDLEEFLKAAIRTIKYKRR